MIELLCFNHDEVGALLPSYMYYDVGAERRAFGISLNIPSITIVLTINIVTREIPGMLKMEG